MLDLREPEKVLRVKTDVGEKSFKVISPTRGLKRKIQAKFQDLQERFAGKFDEERAKEAQAEFDQAIDEILQALSPGSNFDDIPEKRIFDLVRGMIDLAASDDRSEDIKKKRPGRPRKNSNSASQDGQQRRQTG